MSFWKKVLRPAAPNATDGDGTLRGSEDAQTSAPNPPTEELFSTVGDYGLQTISSGSDDIIE